MADIKSKEFEKEFMEYFSFGRYLELHQRVEYLEDELDRQSLVKRRVTCSNARKRPGQLLEIPSLDTLQRYKSNFSDDEEDEEDEGVRNAAADDRVETDYRSVNSKRSKIDTPKVEIEEQDED